MTSSTRRADFTPADGSICGLAGVVGSELVVVIVGAVTLLFGAIIGCAKDDIKKALAASTMSQIGYMVLAAGLGPAGYAFAILHLITHGFFKAGLFLGAGSVMHAMNDETDMRRYGGLRAFMPLTFVTFGLGYLAIIGVPPFAGFFAKYFIFSEAIRNRHLGLTIIAIVNSVVDALSHLGVRHIDMPLTPEKVWNLIQTGGQK